MRGMIEIERGWQGKERRDGQKWARGCEGWREVSIGRLLPEHPGQSRRLENLREIEGEELERREGGRRKDE